MGIHDDDHGNNGTVFEAKMAGFFSLVYDAQRQEKYPLFFSPIYSKAYDEGSISDTSQISSLSLTSLRNIFLLFSLAFLQRPTLYLISPYARSVPVQTAPSG